MANTKTTSGGLNFTYPALLNGDYVVLFDPLWAKVSSHDHEGGGTGKQLTGSALVDGTLSAVKLTFNNDESLKATVAAGTSTTNLLKLNTDDKLELETQPLILNNVFFQSRNAADSADVNSWKIDGNDDLAFGAEVSVLTLKNATYLTARNNAGSANLNVLRATTGDLLEFATQVGVLNLANNTSLTGRNNADGANIDIVKITTGDLLSFGDEVALLTMAQNTFFTGRNAADSANIDIIKVDSNDDLAFGAEVSVLKLKQNISLAGRNAADDGDVAIVKVDSNDDLAFGAQVSVLNLKQNTFLTGRNAADGGDIDILKINASDIIELGAAVITDDVIPSADGTEDLGTTSVSYQRLYVHNISFNDGTDDLTDYEEGTFTPTIIGGSTAGAGTYSEQVGYYTKIGRVVTIHISMTWSAHTGSGFTIIGALPFTIANLAGSGLVQFSIGIANFDWDSSTYTQVVASAQPNTTQITFIQLGDAIADATVTLDTAATLRLSGSYFV